MLHLMRQALADTAATGQDDRPAAGGDVDMVDQGAAAPDPEVPTGVSLSKAQNESRLNPRSWGASKCAIRHVGPAMTVV